MADDDVSWRGTHTDRIDPVYAAAARAADAARDAARAALAAAPGVIERGTTAIKHAVDTVRHAAGDAVANAAAPPFTPPDGAGPARGRFACVWRDEVKPVSHDLEGGPRVRLLKGVLYVTDGAAFFVESGGGGGGGEGGAPHPITLPLDRVASVGRTVWGVRVELVGGGWAEVGAFGGEEAAADAAALLGRGQK